MVASLDVPNAFNTAPCRRIDAALRARLVSPLLIGMIRFYLEDRTLLVGEANVIQNVICGVSQGSVLGPTLWNVFDEGLLETELP